MAPPAVAKPHGVVAAAAAAGRQQLLYIHRAATLLLQEDNLLLLSRGLDADGVLLQLLALLQQRNRSNSSSDNSTSGSEPQQHQQEERGIFATVQPQQQQQQQQQKKNPLYSAAWPRLVLVLGLTAAEHTAIHARQQLQHQQQRRYLKAAAAAAAARMHSSSSTEAEREEAAAEHAEAAAALVALEEQQGAEELRLACSSCSSSAAAAATATTWQQRQQLYIQGGCFCCPAAVAAGDFLTGKLPPEVVDCIVFVHAERISGGFHEAFVCRVYRQRNRLGGLKALSDRPQHFAGRSSSGSSNLTQTLKLLQLQRVRCMHRMHPDVKDTLEGAAQPQTSEVCLPPSSLQLEIQQALLLLLQRGLQQLKKCHQGLLQDWDVSCLFKGVSATFIQLNDDQQQQQQKQHRVPPGGSLRKALDSVWHQLDSKTKGLVADLGELRRLVFALWRLNSVSFLSLLESLLSSKTIDEAWGHTTELQVILRRAKQRVYTIKRVPTSVPGPAAAAAGKDSMAAAPAEEGFAAKQQRTETGATPTAAGAPAAATAATTTVQQRYERRAVLTLEVPSALEWLQQFVWGCDVSDDIYEALLREQHATPAAVGAAAAASRGGRTAAGEVALRQQQETTDGVSECANVECIQISSGGSSSDSCGSSSSSSSSSDSSETLSAALEAPSLSSSAAKTDAAPAAATAAVAAAKLRKGRRVRLPVYRILVITGDSSTCCSARLALLLGARQLLVRCLGSYVRGLGNHAASSAAGGAAGSAAAVGDAGDTLSSGFVSNRRAEQQLLLQALRVKGMIGLSPGDGMAAAAAAAAADSDALSDRALWRVLRWRTRALRVRPLPRVVSASDGSAAVSLALLQHQPHAVVLLPPLLSCVRLLEGFCAAALLQQQTAHALAAHLAEAPAAATATAAAAPAAASGDTAADVDSKAASPASAKPAAAAAAANVLPRGVQTAGLRPRRQLALLQKQRLVGPHLRVYLVAAADSLLLQQYVHSVQEEAAAWQHLELAVQHLMVPMDDLLRLAPHRLQQQELLQQLLPWGPERLRAALHVAAQLHGGDSSSSGGRTAAEAQAAKASLLLQLRAVGVEPSQALNSWRGGGVAAAAAAAAAAATTAAAKAAGDELLPTVVVDAREMRCSLPYELFCKQVHVHPTTITVGDYVLTRDICVERKAISDLIQSLNTGRLYHQARLLVRHYQSPCLLLDFAGFPVQLSAAAAAAAPNSSSSRRQGGDILHPIWNKLLVLLLHFPSLRLLWAPDSAFAASLFVALKVGREQPNLQKIAEIDRLVLSGDAAPTSEGDPASSELQQQKPPAYGNPFFIEDSSAAAADVKGDESSSSKRELEAKQSADSQLAPLPPPAAAAPRMLPAAAATNSVAVDLLRRLPGITPFNINVVVSRVRCLSELAAMNEEELQRLLGREEGKHLHAFLNTTILLDSLDAN